MAGAQAFGEGPFYNVMTRNTQPLLTATPLAEGGDAVGVGGVGVGLRRYKGVFEGQYGLFLPFLKAQILAP